MSSSALMQPLDSNDLRANRVGVAAAGRAALFELGYAQVRNVLDATALASCRKIAERLGATLASSEYRCAHASIGSLVDVLLEPEVVDLITWPRAFGVLGALGFPDPRFVHGILFDKAPHTPPTFWHQDGTSWNHPASYAAAPQELILIYYLVDTTPHNGCLRVIPGSHRRRHPLHDWLANSCTEDLRRMADAGSPAFSSFPEELALPVSAGDLIILDSRVLHAAHANEGAARRPALSLWYAPDMSVLPEGARARFSWEPREGCRLPYLPSHWPEPDRRRLAAVLPPRYEGTAEPLTIDSNPGARLT